MTVAEPPASSATTPGVCTNGHPAVVFNWANLTGAKAGVGEGYWIRISTNPNTPLATNLNILAKNLPANGCYTWNGGASQNAKYYYWITYTTVPSGLLVYAATQGSFASGTCPVVPPPTASISQSAATSAPGQTFTVSWGSTNASSCHVYYDGTDTTWAGTTGSQSPSLSVLGAHTFTNACTNSLGQTASASLTHTVVAPPKPVCMNYPEPTCPAGQSPVTPSGTDANGCALPPVCEPNPTAAISQSAATTASNQPFSVTWGSTNASSCSVTHANPGGSPAGFSSGTSGSQSTSLSVLGAHLYKNTCTDAFGRRAVAQVSHTVVSSPSVSCKGTPGNPYVNQPVTWTASASGGTGSYSYAWSGTDGLSGSGASVQKSYASVGTKTASVTVADTTTHQTAQAACTAGTSQPPSLPAGAGVQTAPSSSAAAKHPSLPTPPPYTAARRRRSLGRLLRFAPLPAPSPTGSRAARAARGA